MLKLIWRNLRTRVMRSLLTVVGILLGVAAMLAVQVTNATTLSSIRGLFEEAAGRADLVVESSDIGGSGFDEGVLARIRTTEGVKLAAPSVRAETLLAKNLARWQMPIAMAGIGKGGLLIVGVDPEIDPQVRPYHLKGGRFLSAKERKHTIVLGESFAEEEKIELGELVARVEGKAPLKPPLSGPPLTAGLPLQGARHDSTHEVLLGEEEHENQGHGG